MAPLMASGGRVLSFFGGAFLLWCAARTLMRRRSLVDQPDSVTLSPIIGLSAPSLREAAVLLFGMFSAAATWWVCLSGGITLLRARLSPEMLLVVNQVAGAMLTCYGALALARSAGM